MAIWSGLGAGARTVLVVGAAAAVGAAAWFGPSGKPQTPATQPDPVAAAGDAVPVPPVTVAPVTLAPVTATPVVAPEVAAVAVAPPADPAAALPADPAAATPPQFDVVRVEPDGSATIAGYAAPRSTVSVRVDGAEVITAPTDASGNFAVLFTLPPSAAARLLSLAMVMPDGAAVLGTDTVALAPTVAAVVAGDAAPAAVQPVAKADAVTSAAPPAALLVTEAGVEVLQSGTEPALGLAANVSVDTISYSAAGDVQLGGRGQGAAFVRLYLDSAEISTVVVGADGQWSTVLADVAPGIYTLRADQIGEDGKVTSRFETPFKRETLQALAAAAAPAPVAKPDAAPIVVQAEPGVVETVAPVVAQPVTPVVVEPAIVAVAPDPVVDPAPATVAAEPAAPQPAPAEIAATDPPPAGADPAPAASAPEPAPADVVIADPAPATMLADAVPEPAAKPALVSITVQPGFTLWSIAKQQMGEGVMYVQVFEANKDKIRDPDLIYPGQVFTLPAAN